MLSTISSVSALLISFAILCLGHGLQNTLLGVRAEIEYYPEWVMGMMMSCYFLGFVFGTNLCGKLILTVGQIRTFAAFASIASAISLLHVLFINEYSWIILRFIYGMCIAGLYMVIESWLNALSNRKNRGVIFSFYMTISFLSLSIGQSFMILAKPDKYILFAVVSILVSISLVPVTLSKSKQPEGINAEHFTFKKLISISPLATFGCMATGLTLGSFWGFGAIFFSKIGLEPEQVALAIAITFLGGLIFQMPIGYLSDIFNRRLIIVITLFFSVIVTFKIVLLTKENIEIINLKLAILLILFGGFNYTLYSLFIALANDYLKPEMTIKASGGLISIHAIGAIFGPIIAAAFMLIFGNIGLFIFIMFINLTVLSLSILRAINNRKIKKEYSEPFMAFPRTGTVVAELDPRQEHHD